MLRFASCVRREEAELGSVRRHDFFMKREQEMLQLQAYGSMSRAKFSICDLNTLSSIPRLGSIAQWSVLTVLFRYKRGYQLLSYPFAQKRGRMAAFKGNHACLESCSSRQVRRTNVNFISVARITGSLQKLEMVVCRCSGFKSIFSMNWGREASESSQRSAACSFEASSRSRQRQQFQTSKG